MFFKDFAPYFALELLNKFSVNTVNKKISMDGFFTRLKNILDTKDIGSKVERECENDLLNQALNCYLVFKDGW